MQSEYPVADHDRGYRIRVHSVSTLKGLSSLLHQRVASLENERSSAEYERNCLLGVLIPEQVEEEEGKDHEGNDEYSSEDGLDMLDELELNEENSELAEWLESV